MFTAVFKDSRVQFGNLLFHAIIEDAKVLSSEDGGVQADLFTTTRLLSQKQVN